MPVIQAGFALFLMALVWWAFAKRRRVVVTLNPGDPIAVLEERLLDTIRRRTAPVVRAEVEMGQDIDILESHLRSVLGRPTS